MLVGMMGVGKTTVGQKLAGRLQRPFIDTDHLIEAREMRAIDEIFRAKGEDYFRDVESSVIAEVVKKPSAVIAVGGGALQRQENRGLLRQHSRLVWLRADAETIVVRTRGHSRPLLEKEDRRAAVENILKEREPFYAQADVCVDTEGKNSDEVAEELYNRLEGRLIEHREEQ